MVITMKSGGRTTKRTRIAYLLVGLLALGGVAASAYMIAKAPVEASYDPGTQRVGDEIHIRQDTYHRADHSQPGTRWAKEQWTSTIDTHWRLVGPAQVRLADGSSVEAIEWDHRAPGSQYLEWPRWSREFVVPGSAETVARTFPETDVVESTQQQQGILGTEEEEVTAGYERVFRVEGQQFLSCLLENPLPGGRVVAGMQVTMAPCRPRLDWENGALPVTFTVRDRVDTRFGLGWTLVWQPDEESRLTSAELTVVDRLPYPVRLDVHNEHGLVIRQALMGLQRGEEPVRLQDAPAPPALPALEFSARTPWLLPDDDAALPYPPSTMWADVLGQVTGNGAQEFMQRHPTGYVAKATTWSETEGPWRYHHWEIVLASEYTHMEFQVKRTEPAAAPGVLIQVDVSKTYQGINDRWVPPSRLPGQVPTLASLLQQAEAKGHELGERIGWEYRDRCGLTCGVDWCHHISGCMGGWGKNDDATELVVVSKHSTPVASAEPQAEGWTTFKTAWNASWLPTASYRESRVQDPPPDWGMDLHAPGVASVGYDMDGPWPVIGSVSLLAAIAAVLVLAKPLHAFGALFTRLRPDELEDEPSRARIMTIVRAEPGIHFRRLMRRSDLTNGALDHHLHQLVSGGRLRIVRGAGRSRYYPKGVSPGQVPAIAHNPGAQAVLQVLAGRPGLSASDVARSVGITRSTANYHVRRLADAGLIRDGGAGRAAAWRLSDIGEEALEGAAGAA